MIDYLIRIRIQVFNLMTPNNYNTKEGEALRDQYILLSDFIDALTA